MIYGALEDPAQWRQFLDEFLKRIGGGHALFVIQYANSPQASVAQYVGATDHDFAEYTTKWAQQDPWMIRAGFGRYPIGKVVPSQEICPDDELEVTQIYNEFLKPRNWHYGGGVYLASGTGQMAVLSCIRAKSLGPLSADELDWWQSLTPHLMRAVRIHGERERLNGEANLLRYHFNSGPLGIVQLTEDSLVLAANSVATNLIERKNAFQLSDGRLTATDPNSNQLLQSAIAAVGSRIRMAQPQPTQIRVRCGNEEMLAIVCESPGSDHPRVGTNAPTVYCYLIDPSEPQRINSEILVNGYGLTPAEAKVASHLGTGVSTENASKALNLSPSTVRTHLTRIFSKTGCRRQSELVALLSRLPPAG